jgi:flagellar motor switch protein FliM
MSDKQVKKSTFESNAKKGIRAIIESKNSPDQGLNLQKSVEQFCIILSNSLSKIANSPIRCTLASSVAKLEKTECSPLLKEAGDLFISFKCKSLKTKGCIGLNGTFASSLIENLLGGSNQQDYSKSSRNFKDQFPTLIEQIVINKAAKIILESLKEGFSFDEDVAYVIEQLRMGFDFDIFNSNDHVSYLLFSIDSKHYKGTLSIAFPFCQKQVIASERGQKVLPSLNDSSGMILHNLKDTIFCLNGTIPCRGLKNLSELLKLKVGETLMLDHNVEEDVLLQCQDFVIARGKMGESHKNIAVSVNKILI